MFEELVVLNRKRQQRRKPQADRRARQVAEVLLEVLSPQRRFCGGFCQNGLFENGLYENSESPRRPLHGYFELG